MQQFPGEGFAGRSGEQFVKVSAVVAALYPAVVRTVLHLWFDRTTDQQSRTCAKLEGGWALLLVLVKNEDLRTVGRTLGVPSVLGSSVSREGDRESTRTHHGTQH